jgi:hypothetical protein
MAVDPITAVSDLIKIGLNKFVADKMNDKDREELSQKMEMFLLTEARNEASEFRDFVLEYEGTAKDIPKIVNIMRAMIRPCFTILVGWMDYLFFTGPTTAWSPDAIAMLKAINIIVLAFWFGERALRNSGLIQLLLAQKK